LAIAGGLLLTITPAGPSSAQKPSGVLRMPIGNSPASMSIHEEATRIAVTPMMAVFNNLVVFDQHIAQNTFESIRPDLAENWSWDEDKTALTLSAHSVKWHDGTPLQRRT
jgi:peptide/nickel transport system substrate-binding protein